MLDPALLFALVVREKIGFARSKGLIDTAETYVMLPKFDQGRWQRAVDAIQTLVMGHPGTVATHKIEYLSGLSLDIRSDYITCDDHDLEAKVTHAFGFLAPRNTRAGDLMRYVIATVLNDFPELLPRDLLETFDVLLAVELS